MDHAQKITTIRAKLWAGTHARAQSDTQQDTPWHCEKLPNILGTTNLPSWWIIAVYCSLLLQLTSSDCIRLGGELTLRKKAQHSGGHQLAIIVGYCSSLQLITAAYHK
jgi:hypothetical protein